jgi:hypothetical protein
MNSKRLVILLFSPVLLFLPLLPPLAGLSDEPGLAGGKLSAADQKKFAERFSKEVWPLLTRRGKDGCVGCHHPKHRTELRFSGKPDSDLAMLLKEGFLIPDDPGSLLAVVTTRKRGRMPPGNRTAWTAAEVKVLRAFETDLNKSLKRGSGKADSP